ncbi:uncharacterized protein DUF4199 [Gelidibacter sediminis]|uniref:Uncharacterized protein DUF4199 n=1 Tax=Gelidibacter sediminis TaxID=1608710 RepID=A0A4V6Q4L4_9FLAO|nr:DUF4199 domain-containing protein [Gelidibacter sediminis]TDU39696.1 uncharacterized protein DUF4199 [Gelidibacter sediminis]
METQKPSIKPIAYTYGLYLALVSIIILVIMYVANLQQSWILSAVSSLASIVVLVYGIKTYKHQNAGFLTVGEAIKVGLAIAVIGGILAAIYAYLHYAYIYPEFIDMARDKAYLDISEQNPNMSEEQISKTMEISNIFMTPMFFSLTTVIGSLLFGLVVSVIAGLVMKKD